MPTLAERLNEELNEKRRTLADLFKKHTTADGLKMAPEDCTEARKRNDELAELAVKWEEQRDLEKLEADNAAALKAAERDDEPQRPRFQGGEGAPASLADEARRLVAAKSWGEQFVESQAYKSWEPKARTQRLIGHDIDGMPPMAAKATFATSGSGFTQYDRPPVGIILLEQQKLTVADLLSQGETTMNTIRYPRENSYTNAATTVAEGASKPEASWDTVEADAPVRKIAVTSKITEEMFDDFPVIRDYINSRLPFMVRQTEESQLLNGNGTPPNITGLLNVTGIQTQATGTDTNPDAIYKAIVKVRTVGFFEPDALAIHPNNWTPIRLLKTTTGEYVWGHPSENGPERIWGLYVDVTVNITANTALVGAYKLGGQVFYRMGVRIEATNSNEDDFKKNLIALRAEQREALACYRPLAFCRCTGLNT